MSCCSWKILLNSPFMVHRFGPSQGWANINIIVYCLFKGVFFFSLVFVLQSITILMKLRISWLLDLCFVIGYYIYKVVSGGVDWLTALRTSGRLGGHVDPSFSDVNTSTANQKTLQGLWVTRSKISELQHISLAYKKQRILTLLKMVFLRV